MTQTANISSNGQKSNDLHALIGARFDHSMNIPKTFFTTEADRIAQACLAMASRFHRGGRLIAFGNGAWASDAQHVAVEFVHPVIVGKRALPALALTNDSALLGGTNNTGQGAMQFTRQLMMLARTQDIAMGFSFHGDEANILEALALAKEMGLLTLGLTSGNGGMLSNARLDFCFCVESDDPLTVQETHETLYHVLWELVHIFFEHEGLLS
jgi:D-sedoheptulose 7-phosphate isomerase